MRVKLKNAMRQQQKIRHISNPLRPALAVFNNRHTS